jgi:cell division protein FtsW
MATAQASVRVGLPAERAQSSARRWARVPQFLNPASLILVCAVGLTVLGVTTLFSASSSFRSDPYFFVRRQVMWLGAALLVGFVVSRLNLERLRRFTWWMLGLLAIGLVVTLVPGIGVSVNGARRWLEFGMARLQVSEFAKLGLVFALAHYLAANQKSITTLQRGFLAPLALIGTISGLIIIEPDFGTAMLAALVGFVLLFAAGVRLIYLLPTAILGAAGCAYAIMQSPERWGRVMAFVDLENNRGGAGYQLWQAILGFGTGGVEGVGLGSGRQQMFFLPEAHTDFIFAIVGEELGLAFTLAVVVAFTAIFIAGIAHLRRAPNLFQYLLVLGSVLLLTLQAIINLCVVTGLMPTKGMSLPFLSYGGSNLLLMSMIVGIILNTQIAWSRPALADRDRGLKDLDA